MNLLYNAIHTVFNFILQTEQSIDLQFKFRGIHLLVDSLHVKIVLWQLFFKTHKWQPKSNFQLASQIFRSKMGSGLLNLLNVKDKQDFRVSITHRVNQIASSPEDWTLTSWSLTSLDEINKRSTKLVCITQILDLPNSYLNWPQWSYKHSPAFKIVITIRTHPFFFNDESSCLHSKIIPCE